MMNLLLKTRNCVLKMMNSADLVKQLEGLQWARFYEQWPDEFHMRSQWYPGSREGDRFAQTISNGILEAKAGIPVVAHATPHNNSCQNGQFSMEESGFPIKES